MKQETKDFLINYINNWQDKPREFFTPSPLTNADLLFENMTDDELNLWKLCLELFSAGAPRHWHTSIVNKPLEGHCDRIIDTRFEAK